MEDKVLDPDSKEWQRAANTEARNFVTIVICYDCGYPVVKGYCCNHCGSVDPSRDEAGRKEFWKKVGLQRKELAAKKKPKLPRRKPASAETAPDVAGILGNKREESAMSNANDVPQWAYKAGQECSELANDNSAYAEQMAKIIVACHDALPVMDAHAPPRSQTRWHWGRSW